MSLLRHFSVLVLAVGIFFAQGPEFVHHLDDRISDAGDSLLNTWILAWNAHALFNSRIHVWDAPIFYPVKNTFSFSETMFGNLWITLPIQYLTGNPILAFNFLVLASFVLGMYCTFLLVHRLTNCYLAGLVAGFLFSFNPWRWSEIPHVQLLPFFWAPLALLFCQQFLEKFARKPFVALFAVMLAQFYTSIYLGTILLTLLLVFVTIHCLLERSGAGRFFFANEPRVRRLLLVGLALGFIALLPVGLPYLQTTRIWYFDRSEAENVTGSCEPLSLLVPNAAFATYRWCQPYFAGRIHGCQGLGLTPWLLAVIGFVLVRREQAEGRAFGARRVETAAASYPVVKRFAWTALVMALLMLGPYLIVFNEETRLPMPYLLVYHCLPITKALRVPARFIVPLLLCLSVLSGYSIARIVSASKRWRPAWRAVVHVVVAGCLWVDYAVTKDPGVRMATPDRFPPVYQYLAQAPCDRPILELPARWMQHFEYLYYQTAHWRPLLGGESGSYPRAILETVRRTQEGPTDECLRFLSLTPAMTLVVHLDRLDGATANAWQAARLEAFGFGHAGRIGDALVWERAAPGPEPGQKLRVTRADIIRTRRHWREKVSVQVELRPAEEGRCWRYLERGVADIDIVLIDAAGSSHRYTKRLEIPPYLVAGESARVTIGSIGKVPADIRRVRLRGAPFEEYEQTVGP